MPPMPSLPPHAPPAAAAAAGPPMARAVHDWNEGAGGQEGDLFFNLGDMIEVGPWHVVCYDVCYDGRMRGVGATHYSAAGRSPTRAHRARDGSRAERAQGWALLQEYSRYASPASLSLTQSHCQCCLQLPARSHLTANC